MDLLTFGPFRLDLSTESVWRAGEEIRLRPKTFAVLRYLVERPTRLVTKEELLESLWSDVAVGDATLAVCVGEIRKALGDEARTPRFIETVHRRGYRFVGVLPPPVEIVERPDEKPREAIAVLPFRSLSADEGDEYLGLGLADALITRLSTVGRIIARPTSAVLKYAGTKEDPVEVGRELRVHLVLEGSIQRRRDHVRVTVQVVSVRDEAVLWAGTFDEQFTDIFAVEDSISRRVATALALQLSDEETRRLTRRQTEDSGAYQLYLKGRYFWYKRTADGLRKGIDYFHQAIGRDPAYAAAYAGISDSYTLLAIRGVMPPRDALRKAKAAARKALEIDETLAEAHASLAHIKLHDWDWAGLEEGFQRALELNRNYAIAYHWYAEYLGAMKRFDEAIVAVRRAEEIDPLSAIVSTALGSALGQARRYDEAIKQNQKGLELDPNHFRLRYNLALAYVQTGQFVDAIEEMRRAVALSGRSTETLAGLGRVYATAEMTAEAKAILGELGELPPAGYVSPYCLAMLHAALADTDQAFACLERAYRERNPNLIELNTEPAFDGLHADPRYEELVRRIGLVL